MRSGPTVAYRVAIGWLLAILLLTLSAVGASKHTMFIPADYSAWHADWSAVAQCFARGDIAPCHGVTKFPLAYLVNAWVAGSPGDRGHKLLSMANAFSLLLPLAALWMTSGLRVLLKAGWAYVAAVALSPLPMFYVATGAMELQSGIFCGLYLGAFARSLASPGLRPGSATTWLLVISGFVFPLYKDTVAVFMGLALLPLLVMHQELLREMAATAQARSQLLRITVMAAAPVIGSQLLAAAYCWFKYGVPWPLAYMDEAAKASPSVSKSAEFLLGSVLSPNGGVLVFWGLPAFVALMAWRAVGLLPRKEVVIGAAALCVVSCLAFAHWWATFGWDSWGNRLMVPATLAALVAALQCLRLRSHAEKERTIAPVILAYTPLLVCSAYYVILPYSMRAPISIENSLWSGPACIHMRGAMSTEAIAQGLAFWRGDAYYRCARERMLYVPRP